MADTPDPVGSDSSAPNEWMIACRNPSGAGVEQLWTPLWGTTYTRREAAEQAAQERRDEFAHMGWEFRLVGRFVGEWEPQP